MITADEVPPIHSLRLPPAQSSIRLNRHMYALLVLLLLFLSLIDQPVLLAHLLLPYLKG